MEKRITQADNGSTVLQNVAGEYSPIFKYNVGAGEVLDLINGKAKLLCKLYKDGGTQLASGKLLVGVLPPDQEIPIQVAVTPYSVYHEMSIADQADSLNKDFVLLNLQKEGQVNPDDELWIMLNSSEQVDWGEATEVVLVVEKYNA